MTIFKYKPFLKLFYIIIAAFLFTGCPTEVSASGFHFPPDDDGQLVIVIDPGHGGENLGADYNGFLEKKMTMTVAKSMYEELLNYDDVTVYLTHEEDIDMSLQERADFANSVNADFLFCLHFNMSPSKNLFGSEVWISAFGEENREGYRFGAVQLNAMKEMGLYIRGVKTKFNSRNTDYYGILRTCEEYGIPAALIEHCHVDNEKDTGFCDSEEDLIAFGKADALAAAKYFGLSSQSLGVSYADYADIPLTEAGSVYMQPDTTEPDICYLYREESNYETGDVTLTLTAQDYDTPMLYYSYSIDGGETWTQFFAWPESDVMSGYSPNSFSITINIPSGVLPNIMARAYNQYDLYAESNQLLDFTLFDYGKDSSAEPDGSQSDITQGETEASLEAGGSNVKVSVPDEEATEKDSTDTSFLSFLKICLFCVILLFITLFITKIVLSRKSKRSRRR